MGLWVWIIASIFQAGVVYAGFRTMAKDVNGIGRKIANVKHENERREMVMIVQMLLDGISEDKRESYKAKVQMLLDVK